MQYRIEIDSDPKKLVSLQAVATCTVQRAERTLVIYRHPETHEVVLGLTRLVFRDVLNCWYIPLQDLLVALTENHVIQRAEPLIDLDMPVPPADWFPAWLRLPWIAKDGNGSWWAYAQEPVLAAEDQGWDCARVLPGGVLHLDPAVFDISAFPRVSWRDSLFANPYFPPSDSVQTD